MSSLAHLKSGHCGCSCSSKKSMIRRHPVMSVAGGLLTAAAVVGVISMLPDIVRYIRIKTM